MRLVSVYAPSRLAEREDFYMELRVFLHAPTTLVVGGYFNRVLSGRGRVLGSTVLRGDVGAPALRGALRQFTLVDMTETLDAFSPCFTK